MKKTEIFSNEIKNEISRKIFPLGEEIPELINEMSSAGFDSPSEVFRGELKKLAGTEKKWAAVQAYWMEYAKERLASLAGPVDILKGHLPEFSAYRSALLEALRSNADKQRLDSKKGLINSFHIEPTIKEYAEILPSSPFLVELSRLIKNARIKSSEIFLPMSQPEFVVMNCWQRLDVLKSIYADCLVSAGFKISSSKKSDVIFRKQLSYGGMDFAVVDYSGAGLETGLLAVNFALTPIDGRLNSNFFARDSIAFFSPKDLIPGFDFTQGFKSDSLPQFFLAASASAKLASIVYARIDSKFSLPR